MELQSSSLSNASLSSVAYYSDINRYLASLLNPWKFQSNLPDDNMTASRLKTVNWSTTFTAAVNEYLILIPFHSMYRTARLYIKDSVNNQYHFISEISQTDDFAANYKSARFVSGGMSAKSSTVTGNAFTVSGNFTAISVQDLPNLKTVTYDNLSAFKRDATSFVSNVAVSDGIVVLASPDEDINYRALLNGTTHVANEEIVREEFPSTDGAWLAGNVTTNTIIFQSSARTLFSDNAFGRVALSGKIRITCPINAASSNITIAPQFTYRSGNPATGAKILTPIGEFSTYPIPPLAGATQFTFDVNFERWDLREVESVQILASMSTGTAVFGTTGARATIISYDQSEFGVQEPACIIAVRSLGIGQQVSLSGVANYEVVPNSNLAKDVSTDFSFYRDPDDLAVAQAVFQNRDKFGVRLVYMMPEYERLLTDDIKRFSTRRQAIASAASVSATARNIWDRVRPLLKEALPTIGRHIGRGVSGFTGVPGLDVIGENLGNLGAYAMGSSTKSHDSRGRPYANCSSEETDVTDITVELVDIEDLIPPPKFNRTTLEICTSHMNLLDSECLFEVIDMIPDEYGPVKVGEGGYEWHLLKGDRSRIYCPDLMGPYVKVTRLASASSVPKTRPAIPKKPSTWEPETDPNNNNNRLSPASEKLEVPEIDLQGLRVSEREGQDPMYYKPVDIGVSKSRSKWFDKLINAIYKGQAEEVLMIISDGGFFHNASFPVTINGVPQLPYTLYLTKVPLYKHDSGRKTVYNNHRKFFVDEDIPILDHHIDVMENSSASTIDTVWYITLSKDIPMKDDSHTAALMALLNWGSPGLLYTGSDNSEATNIKQKIETASYDGRRLLIVNPKASTALDTMIVAGLIVVKGWYLFTSDVVVGVIVDSIAEAVYLSQVLHRAGAKQVAEMTGEEKEEAVKFSEMRKGEKSNPIQKGINMNDPDVAKFMEDNESILESFKVPLSNWKERLYNKDFESAANLYLAVQAKALKGDKGGSGVKRPKNPKNSRSKAVWDKIGGIQ